MGNLRSVEKALEKVGAEAEITSDLDGRRARRRRHPARRRRVPEGDGAGPRDRARRARRRAASTRAARCSASASGCSCCSTTPPRTRGRRGLGLMEGPVGPLSANGYKVPHIGWSPVRWEHESELTEGLGPEPPFYFVHSFVPRPSERRGRARHGRLRRALRLRRRARRRSTASSSIPRSRAAAGLRAARELHCASARPDPGLILYPAIDIRDGRAVRLVQGDYERETAFDDDPVVAAMRWEADGAQLAPRRRPRRGPRRASRPTSTTCGGSSPRSGSRSSSAGACATRARSRRRSRPASSASCSAPPPCATPRWPRRSPPRTAIASSRPWTPRPAWWPPRAGPRPRALTPADLASELSARGVQRFIYTPVEVDGMMEGPDLESLREVAAATDAEVIYSGGVGRPRRPARARLARASPTSAG